MSCSGIIRLVSSSRPQRLYRATAMTLGMRHVSHVSNAVAHYSPSEAWRCSVRFTKGYSSHDFWGRRCVFFKGL